jgi:hypothetical protein
MVELRQVAEHDGYWASSDGRIYSDRSGQLIELAQRIMGKGYLYVNIKTMRADRLVQVPMQVHRLVLLAFTGPEPFAHADGRHKDGNSMDCGADNLEWGTRKQNIADAIRHGTHISTRKVRGPYRKSQGDAGFKSIPAQGSGNRMGPTQTKCA